jgi:hypothetical protein
MMTIASAASGPAGAASVLPDLPKGLEPWMAAWIGRAEEENRVLRENGAEAAAAGRCRLLVQFVEAAREWLDAEVDVAEAAEVTGRCEETVRRAVRAGELPDRRHAGRGRHRVRRGDLPALTRGYDPAADAVRLAGLRGA